MEKTQKENSWNQTIALSGGWGMKNRCKGGEMVDSAWSI